MLNNNDNSTDTHYTFLYNIKLNNILPINHSNMSLNKNINYEIGDKVRNIRSHWIPFGLDGVIIGIYIIPIPNKKTLYSKNNIF